LPVSVPTFLMDTHEVTLAEYRTCVSAGKCTEPLTNSRDQYCNCNHPERDRHPINCWFPLRGRSILIDSDQYL